MSLWDFLVNLFDLNTYKTGETAPASGVLKCLKCSKKISINKGRTIPPCSKCGGDEFSYIIKTRD